MANEIHIWQQTLLPTSSQQESLAACLSEAEQQRVQQYHSAAQRTAFVAVRGRLRCLLGHYLDVAPTELRFGRTPDGKPYLQGGGPSLCFNISHSGQWSLLAFSRGSPLGVDLEQLRPIPPAKCLRLARRFFADAEYSALTRLPLAQVNTAFFTCWSRKEAYIKRHGISIARLLAHFTVSIDPDAPPVLLATPWQPEDAAACQLHDLPAPAGYCAALALGSSKPFVLRHFQCGTGCTN
ncbi:MAG: 4'-phosphopantetheinyl transferase superfamily protein [Magnetococcales bacterium]|nr:4'-phosphopantetheinyl transferase superfamily protein [Magnetococcales bacterium]